MRHFPQHRLPSCSTPQRHARVFHIRKYPMRSPAGQRASPTGWVRPHSLEQRWRPARRCPLCRRRSRPSCTCLRQGIRLWRSCWAQCRRPVLQARPAGASCEHGHPPRSSPQACLHPSAKAGDRAVLLVKSGDAGAPLAVCSLRQGGTECVGLDLIFDSYTEFTVQGKAPVHLTGYHMPEYELGESAGGALARAP